MSTVFARALKQDFIEFFTRNQRETMSYTHINESDKRFTHLPEDNNSDDGLFDERSLPGRASQRPWSRHRNLIVAHIILFAIYAGVLIAVVQNSAKDMRKTGLPFSPAIEALEYHEQKFSLEDRIQEHGSFSGKPSPQLDEAWHDLLNYENIKLEPEVMEHYGRTDIGVALPEGGGYIGTLNVYHELHCLKRLHQYMYQDYYWPDLKPEQLEMNRLHNEHCIDFLRQAAMCHGDIGLITFEWKESSRIPVANATTHQCVNWEKLDLWTRKRSVDMMKPGWLVHPIHGLAYPQGEGDRIGAVVDGSHVHSRNF